MISLVLAVTVSIVAAVLVVVVIVDFVGSENQNKI